MKQVLILHGGSSFSSYDTYRDALEQKQIEYERLFYRKRWREWIAEHMTEADVLLPTMPNGDNAHFDEWSIYFEKLLPFFGDEVQLVGHSLGAMFLAKYLQKKPLAKKVQRIVLIAPAYDDTTNEDSGSFLVTAATRLPESAHDIHLFHSQDDPVVSYAELAKFQSDLPSAIVHSFEDRGHFIDSEFPELLELIRDYQPSSL